MIVASGTVLKEPEQPTLPLARVLCVGGSDPSGAAGIQADLRVLARLGVFGTAAITAVTAQNQHGVTDVKPMPASLVGAQMDAALDDAPVDAVKTGMLANVDIVAQVIGRVRALGTSARLIVDPVLVSSTGRRLLDDDGLELLIKELLPLSALVVPNLPEAERLTGVTIANLDDMSIAVDHLLARGASAVLIKGGHLLGLEPELTEVTDILRTADGEEFRFVRPRIVGPELRGTGCTLASAVAAGIAEGLTLHSAVERARDDLELVMKNSAACRSVRALGVSV
jgi:hydroxymethylpyrimidine/phosphomethylpyrimidine kinase